jgi:hypothetical protein
MRLASDKPLLYRQGGWLHNLGITQKSAVTAADLRPAETGQPQIALAPVEIRHSAISYLLRQLDLSEAHRKYLESEGFAPEQALRLGYRSLPREGRDQLVRQIVALVGPEAARSLAFIYEKKGKGGSRYFQFAAARAEILLIPIRDIDGNFAGLKGRWTNNGERCYRVLSAGSSGGASLGTPLHIARPEYSAQQATLIPYPSSLIPRVIVTEGEKKADFIAFCTGLICIGVQGTGNWRAGGGAAHLVSTLAALGAAEVEIAFDADLENNRRVARDLYQMGCQLQGAGFEVQVRRWPLSAAKGYDDLLRAGLDKLEWLEPFSLHIEESTQSWVKKFVELEPETLAVHREPKALSLHQNIRPLYTVAEAREQHANLFRHAFSQHFFSLGRQRESLVVTSNPGTGKTHAALAEALAALQNFPQGRILYLADNKEVYRQWLQPGALLHEAWEAGIVAVREGRQTGAGPFECRRLEQCLAAGQQRHAPAWDVCADCPFFSQSNWRTYLRATGQPENIPMSWNCRQNGYWQGVTAASNARLVLAPKASFFNHSAELAEFDIIIIDESAVEHLLEKVDVTRETLGRWREGIQRQSGSDWEEAQPFLRLIEVLERALATKAEQLISKETQTPHQERQQLWAALPELQTLEKELVAIVEECMAVPVSSQTGRYIWEKPFQQPDGNLSFPLRFARELVEALYTELSQPHADTRLWLSAEPALVVHLPRQHLLDIIRGKAQVKYNNHLAQAPTVVLLDATPPPVMLKYILGPERRIAHFEVAQHIEITQVTNSLYTRSELLARQGKGLAEVSRILEKELDSYKSAAVFCHKTFNPAASNGPLKLKVEAKNTQITWGHFDRDNKAMNGLSGVEAIAVVGHYCHPLDQLRAQIQAFRLKPATEKSNPQVALWKLRTYGWQDERGRGLARRCRADYDREVQEAIEHCERAAILQAIGRGRPTLRPAGKPLKVLLVTATPLGSCLPVTRLAETKELLGENTISLAQAQALARGRAIRASQQQSQRSEVVKRVQQTLSDLAVEPPKAYLNLAELARITRTAPWQLRLLGFSNYLRVEQENKSVIGPELYIAIYKPIRYANPFVFNRLGNGKAVEVLRI